MGADQSCRSEKHALKHMFPRMARLVRFDQQAKLWFLSASSQDQSKFEFQASVRPASEVLFELRKHYGTSECEAPTV